jgi:Alpha-mannosidase
MKKVFVVTHTHWDREWYTTFEVYRQRLSILLNQLVSIFKTEDTFKHFHLDGQTVVLEDFVENDGMKEEFFELVRQGKIAVGPWYVLPDEFLMSGESFIRNYLYSQVVAKRFGVPLSEVAYLPDMFGHNATHRHPERSWNGMGRGLAWCRRC